MRVPDPHNVVNLTHPRYASFEFYYRLHSQTDCLGLFCGYPDQVFKLVLKGNGGGRLKVFNNDDGSPRYSPRVEELTLTGPEVSTSVNVCVSGCVRTNQN